MKCQYLGDSRDAFKWDLLHWICTRASPRFNELVFVPMLTPDIKGSNEGRTPHDWFECRDFIRPFVASLKAEARSLDRVAALGAVENDKPAFDVSIFGNGKHIGSGHRRADYWSGFVPENLENALVFFDPDNGFETETQCGEKWIRHMEVKEILARLPDTSVAVIYQHRPHRKWSDVFKGINAKLGYVHTAVAAYESNLAFVAIAKTAAGGNRLQVAIMNYAEGHPAVCHAVLREGHE